MKEKIVDKIKYILNIIKVKDAFNFIKIKAIRLYKYIININFRAISKTKLKIAGAVAGIIVAVILISNLINIQDGITIESREEMLKGEGKGKDWQIATELTTDDYIISGVYSKNGRAGIAIYERNGKKYNLKTHTFRDKDEIIFEQIRIDGVWYDLIWFAGAETLYAEITYSVKGNIVESLKTQTTDMQIIYNTSPADEYEIKVVYYDKDGNIYE